MAAPIMTEAEWNAWEPGGTSLFRAIGDPR